MLRAVTAFIRSMRGRIRQNGPRVKRRPGGGTAAISQGTNIHAAETLSDGSWRARRVYLLNLFLIDVSDFAEYTTDQRLDPHAQRRPTHDSDRCHQRDDRVDRCRLEAHGGRGPDPGSSGFPSRMGRRRSPELRAEG